MNIDITSPDHWYVLCDNLSHSLKIAKKNTLRIYPSSFSALFELVISSAQMFSHKRSIAFIRGNSPHTQDLMPHFLREAYQVESPTLAQVTNPTEWVATLKKDTLMVVYCEDHPLTGELFNYEPLDQALNERKIYSVRVSYQSFWRTFAKEELPYSIRINSIKRDLSIAVLGERVRVLPLSVTSLKWPHYELLLKDINEKKAQFFEERTLVEAFEKNLGENWISVCKTEHRLYDRALVSHKQKNGEALQNALARTLGLEIQEPGEECAIEVLSLCRWGVPKMFSGWWDPNPSTTDLRGLVIISAKVIRNPRLQGVELTKTLEQIEKEAYFEL